MKPLPQHPGMESSYPGDSKKKKKKKDDGQTPSQGLAAGPIGARPRLSDLRKSQLKAQGINPRKLGNEQRQQRLTLQQSAASRVDAGRMARKMEANGDLEGAFRIREGLRGQFAAEQGSKYELAQESALLRPSLADLPPNQQVAERQRGRDRLNAQLPGIAQGASLRAQVESDKHRAKLAAIGQKIYETTHPGQSGEGLNPTDLASLAQGADPAIINRVTNGVGLPVDRSGDLRDFADRNAELAKTGVDFGPNVARTREFDPQLIEDVKARQETEKIRNAAIGNIERNTIQQGLTASENIGLGQGRDAAVIEQERTAAELAQRGNIASAGNVDLRAQVEEAQGRQAIAEAGFGAASAEFGAENIGKVGQVGNDTLTVEEQLAYEVAPVDTLNAVRGSVKGQETEGKLRGVLNSVRTAMLTLAPSARAEYAKRMLAKLESSKTDDRPLEDGGYRASIGSRIKGGFEVMESLNPLTPLGALQTAENIAGLAKTGNEKAREDMTSVLHKTIIDELRAAAAGG